MSPIHHPAEAVLADYATGALADGPSLAVSAHLEHCAHCRGSLRLLEAVGGALVDDLAPAEMQADALALALARIERPVPPQRPAVRHRGPEGVVLPKALAARGVGRRLFLAPGFWIAPTPSRKPDGWRTYLLRVPTGAAVPHHGHNGPEYTVILRGAFADGEGRYGVGDFAACDKDDRHKPKAEGPDPCVCLISAQGGMRTQGVLRLLQPLLGV